MITKKNFENLIKQAAQPVKSWGKRATSKGSASRTDKKTRRGKTEDTLEKQHDKSP